MLAGCNKKLTTPKRPCLKLWHCRLGWKSPLHQQLFREEVVVVVECEEKGALQVTLKSGNYYSNFRVVQTEDILSRTTVQLQACAVNEREGGRL